MADLDGVLQSDYLGAIADIVVALAAVATVAITLRGVNAWRQQLRGHADFELARKMLKRVYQIRDSVEHFRVSAVFSYEWADRPGRSPAPLATNDDLAYAYELRWSRIEEHREELAVDYQEAEALWGDELAIPQARLRERTTELNSTTTSRT